MEEAALSAVGCMALKITFVSFLFFITTKTTMIKEKIRRKEIFLKINEAVS
jgi:hypothetical protein